MSEVRQVALCDEGVYVTDGDFRPCERQAVALRRDPEEGSPYPVCRRHVRGDMVSLADVLAPLAVVEALADEWERHPYALISGTPIARLRAALDRQAAEDIWARNAAIFKHEAETPMRSHDATCCARAALGGER